KGQGEAARALGVRFFGIQWLVVIPQALRVALPSLANEYISIVKLTSLVSVISLTEILMVGQRLYSQNFLVLETMAAVAAFYVFIVTLFDFLLKRLEGYLDVTNKKSKVPSAALTAAVNQAPAAALTPPNEFDGPALQVSQLHKAFNNVEVLG
ncbi:ABC transporter permease subunit, partial [Wenyingzhuangia sp. 1_MG-2023]|nr:ABC transporter permease subunit [Wenyingzhuangia sp. 1_MG-2023]